MPSQQAASGLAITYVHAPAFKILHLSHMEILCEVARPEVRLHRLLGHLSVYENASRLWQESRMKSLYFVKRYNQDNNGTPSEDGENQNGMVTKATPTYPKLTRVSSCNQVTDTATGCPL